MKNILRLIRPKHYIKNLLIFFPLVFSGKFFSSNYMLTTFLGFFNFCLIASAVYILNDVRDVKRDQLHPSKKNRPIASGKITVKTALILFFHLILITILINVFVLKSNIAVISIFYIYLLLNILYSFGLKNIAILDMAILSFGFVLRIIYGGLLVNIPVSNWLYLTVLSISLYLTLGKRRNELTSSNQNTRDVLKKYNKEFLDKFMYVCMTMAIIFYSLWASNYQNAILSNYLVYTVLLVILICMKYSLIIEADSDGDPIEVIFGDKVLIFMVALYSLIMFTILYFL